MLREGPTGELALSLVTSTPPKTRLPASAPVGEEIAGFGARPCWAVRRVLQARLAHPRNSAVMKAVTCFTRVRAPRLYPPAMSDGLPHVAPKEWRAGDRP